MGEYCIAFTGMTVLIDSCSFGLKPFSDGLFLNTIARLENVLSSCNFCHSHYTTLVKFIPNFTPSHAIT